MLITRRTSAKASRFLGELHKSAMRSGIDSFVSEQYRQCDVLVLYGLGGADRQEAVRLHGKPFIAWDLGYFIRPGGWRFSFNDYHPTADVMRGPMPGRRFNMPVYDNGGDPDGPVMMVGNGPKSNAVGASGWARHKSAELRQLLPGKRIIYRPKPNRAIESGVSCDGLSYGPIDDALRGVSMVVCRHSNVAVDACRLGVPVVCDAGAAAAIYPNTIDGDQPSPNLRREFLHRLAWWEWADGEADQAWQFIKGKL